MAIGDVAILDMSDNNTSFRSVINESSFIDVPLGVANGSPKSDSGKIKKKKMGFVLLLLLSLIGFASLLIYICVRIDYVANLSGQVTTDLGNFTFNATLGGGVSLSSRLAALTPNTSLWRQTYLD